jgi:competence protein ComEC
VIYITLYGIKNGKYKYLLLLIIMLFIHTNVINLDNEVHFLDVGQGDSILLRLKRKNYLIDTGGNRNYDLSDNLLIPYFKSIGIKKIDHMIITHGDFDHMGSSIELVNNFKVKEIIFNCGEYNKLEKERKNESKNLCYKNGD